jgi:hypothetical protein
MKMLVQGDQKVPAHLTITVQSSGAQRLLVILYNAVDQAAILIKH